MVVWHPSVPCIDWNFEVIAFQCICLSVLSTWWLELFASAKLVGFITKAEIYWKYLQDTWPAATSLQRVFVLYPGYIPAQHYPYTAPFGFVSSDSPASSTQHPKTCSINFRFLLPKHCSEWMLHNPHIISSTLNWKETKKITILPCNHMGPREDTMSSALELGHNLRHLAWQKKKWLLA